MKYPNLSEEKILWKKDYKTVIGLDEAGRGPLAGPVVAGTVSIKNYKFKIKDLKGLKDSKKLSQKQREKFYRIITKHSDLKWGIGIVSEKVIDRVNILEATKLAMTKAVKKLPKTKRFLILDGIMKLNLAIPQKSIIKGDEKVFSCAAASIVAKVTRDRIMARLHEKYPKYRFDLHKGYGTKLHLKMLKRHGLCEIHRETFKPCSALPKNKYFVKIKKV